MPLERHLVQTIGNAPLLSINLLPALDHKQGRPEGGTKGANTQGPGLFEGSERGADFFFFTTVNYWLSGRPIGVRKI